ncbi:MAG: GFA family protein [Acetobacteraceae bacterium]|nr:GFA family protein [Acetobacteraceae bacterium]
MPEIKGGCLCGEVRYSGSGEPTFVGVCHCRDCQKFSGSAFAIIVAVPKSTVSVQGNVKTFTKNADSGKPIERQFCPQCGSAIADVVGAMPDTLMLAAGTLDDPSWVKPAMQIFCDSAQPWVHLGGEIKSFPRMPG